MASEAQGSSRPVWLVGAGFAIVAAIFASWTASSSGFDDFYITYVYARSFAEGHGLTWPGSTGLGTSSPFLAVVLGALSAATRIEVPQVANGLGWFAIAATATGLFALGRREGWPRAGLVAGLLWTLAIPAHNLIGNEYLPAIAAVVWAMHERLGRRFVTAGILLAVAAMFRAECGLAALILAALELRRDDLRASVARIARMALPAAALAAAWLVALFFLAGTVIPRTLGAKQAQVESRIGIWSATEGLESAIRGSSDVFPSTRQAFWLPLALAGAAAVFSRRAPRPVSALALLVWGALHLGLVAALGISFQHWYVGPFRFALLLLPALAVESPPWPRPGHRRAWSLAAAAVLAVVLFDFRGEVRMLHEARPDGRRAAYGQVAQLAGLYPPGTRLAAWEVGFLGWASPRPVVDLLGLVSERATLANIRRGDLRANLDLLQGDLLMTTLGSPEMLRSTFGESHRFLADYRLDHLQLRPVPALTVHRRADLPGHGEVEVDLLAELPPSARIGPRKTADFALLSLELRPGERVEIAFAPGPTRSLRFAASTPRGRARLITAVTVGADHRKHPRRLRDDRWEIVNALLPAAPEGGLIVFACAPESRKPCWVGQPFVARAFEPPPERKRKHRRERPVSPPNRPAPADAP
jgi:arabinofuranosyltransferase